MFQFQKAGVVMEDNLKALNIETSVCPPSAILCQLHLYLPCHTSQLDYFEEDSLV